MPFLTLEDPNEKIKGSRDPLGVGPVWVRFSRHVVTNLTTPSGSVRGFTILILARYFTQLLIDEGRIGKEDFLDVFLRMEQLGAYARYATDDSVRDIRGIERIRKFYREGKGRVRVQADAQSRILADQKIYGLWGLFSVPARVSDLIPDEPIGVTALTQEFIEVNYWREIKPVWPSLAKILVSGGTVDCKHPKKYFSTLMDILSSDFTASEVQFYGDYIRDAKLVRARFSNSQKLFSRLLSESDGEMGRDYVLKIARKAEKYDPGLSNSLYRIVDLEAILATTSVLFSYLLTSNNKKPVTIAEEIEAHWGNKVPNISKDTMDSLIGEIKEATSPETATTIRRTVKALIEGNYLKVINGLLDWNRIVMSGRSSAPWVSKGDNGMLDVRFPYAEHQLPTKAELKKLWIYPYYIDSLRSVCWQLEMVDYE